MKIAYEQQAGKYNLRTKEVNFKVRQEVFRRNFTQSSFEKGECQISTYVLKIKSQRKARKFILHPRGPTGKISGNLSC
jgi:hypothetical protein